MDQANPNFAGDYDTLLELVKSRASVRKLKPDPIPDDHVTQILEVGRWAMSGANGQPWDFVVVKDPAIKRSCFAPTSRRTTTSSTGWSSSATSSCAIPRSR